MGLFSNKQPNAQTAKIKGYSSNNILSNFFSNRTMELASQNVDVFACVNRISSIVSTIPVKVYEYVNGDIKPAYIHPLYRILKETPNQNQTASQFYQTLMIHLLLEGNAYASFTKEGETVTSLSLLEPPKMLVKLVNGRKAFVYDGKPVSNIVHITGYSLDGLMGVSPIQFHASQIDLSNTLSKFTQKMFKNGFQSGGYLKIDSGVQVNDDDIEQIATNFANTYSGVDSAGKIPVIEGMDYKPLSINMRDAVLVEALQLSTKQIAKIFNVPVSMLGDLEKSSYSSLEQQTQSFLDGTLLFWIKRIEQAFNTYLFPQDSKFFCEFYTSAILRTNQLDQTNILISLVNNGLMSPNEARSKLNLSKITGGEVFRQPLNIGSINQSSDKKVANRRKQINEQL